jgi:hypothetical protein
MIKTAAQAKDELMKKIAAADFQMKAEKYLNAGTRRSKISAFYEMYHEDIIESAKKGGINIDIYSFDWEPDWTKSPPENDVWELIRSYNMTMYPQYPVVGCYLDFGDPYRKIGIEVDGAAFHDKDKDIVRDRRLKDNGWTIYRIPARKTFNNQFRPDEDFFYKSTWDQELILEKWLSRADAAVAAVMAKYYRPDLDLNAWYGYNGETSIRQELMRVLRNSCNTND